MVALNMTIDPNNVGSSISSSDPVKPGKYAGEIIDASVMQSKAIPVNSYLSIEWKLENGRHVWDILNLWNANPTAVQIATEKLNRLGVALGMRGIGDTDELMLKTANVIVAIQARDQTRNEITGYEATTAQQDFAEAPTPPSQPAPAQTGAPTQAAPAPASTTPVWAQ